MQDNFLPLSACISHTWELFLYPDITTDRKKNWYGVVGSGTSFRFLWGLPFQWMMKNWRYFLDLEANIQSGCLLHFWPQTAQLKPMLTPERDSIIPTQQFEESSFCRYSIRDSILPYCPGRSFATHPHHSIPEIKAVE